MHLIISGYMDFQMSANGFLYDTSKDIIVQLAFQTGNLWKTLELAKYWISKLDLTDKERQNLQGSLDAVTEADAEVTSWSRHAMQTMYTLDRAILSAYKTENWRSKSIRVLYVCDKEFRRLLFASLKSTVEIQHLLVEFDIQNKLIKALYWQQTPDPRLYKFNFDFEHTFKSLNTPTSFVDGKLTFADIIFASLQGHLRTVMWKMSLKPILSEPVSGRIASHFNSWDTFRTGDTVGSPSPSPSLSPTPIQFMGLVIGHIIGLIINIMANNRGGFATGKETFKAATTKIRNPCQITP